MAYLCIFSLGSRKHLPKDFLAFCLTHGRSESTKSCSYNFGTLPRWNTSLVCLGRDSIMHCMTMAPGSTTGESEKAHPASGIRREGNPSSIAGERGDDLQQSSPILCSQAGKKLCRTQEESMLISATLRSNELCKDS